MGSVFVAVLWVGYHLLDAIAPLDDHYRNVAVSHSIQTAHEIQERATCPNKQRSACSFGRLESLGLPEYMMDCQCDEYDGERVTVVKIPCTPCASQLFFVQSVQVSSWLPWVLHDLNPLAFVISPWLPISALWVNQTRKSSTALFREFAGADSCASLCRQNETFWSGFSHHSAAANTAKKNGRPASANQARVSGSSARH